MKIKKSTLNIGVQKVITRGSAVEEVRKHRDRVIEAWKQISKQRQVDVSYDPSMVTALQHGTWMNEKSFRKTCIKEKEKGRRPRASLRYMGSGLHAETGCRKVYVGEVFE